MIRSGQIKEVEKGDILGQVPHNKRALAPLCLQCAEPRIHLLAQSQAEIETGGHK